MKVRLFVILFVVLFVSANAIVFAQTSGNIRGGVTDIDGNPIPGATVTINSDALIGDSRTNFTNESGLFRFPSVPIGTYSVQVTLDGFKSVIMQNVLVKLDGTGFVPVVLRSSTTAEEVSVVGETPLIDPTKSGFATSYKNEMLSEVPTQRNMWDLMQVSPGVTVDFGDSRETGVIAFGSNVQSNSWNVDGMDVTGPESGNAWYAIDPDSIEEIQVLGIGAPAEYGNHLGAVLNVVTKKGGREFHGSADYFFQTDALTGTNVELPDSPYVFHRQNYDDATFTLGGPILKNNLWFFGAYQYLRDEFTEPGNNPNFPADYPSDKYDFKLSSRLGQNHELTGFYHNEIVGLLEPSEFTEPSATHKGEGDNPTWGGGLTSTLNNNLLLEINYAGWTSFLTIFSATGSLEDPLVNVDVFPATQSGGVAYPYEWDISRHQLKAKITYYAENFLKAQHEFRFGAQYGRGSTQAVTTYGSNGAYLYQAYGYMYKYYHVPYEYGGIANDLGFFVDDTANLTNRLTLNLGVRFDWNRGSIPDFDRYAIGTPSFTKVGNWIKTGEKIQGIDDLVSWKLISPRLGLIYKFDDNASSILKSSFGIYYDHNVIGNWESPPPEFSPTIISILNPETGEFEQVAESPTVSTFNKNVRAPKALQYSVGFEKQLLKDGIFGIEYVYKDTKDLIGWEILDGVYEPFHFVDPFNGSEYTLLNPIVEPHIQKGNSPGNFPGSEGLRYYQKYHGVVLTFEKRFSTNWGLTTSYTWSRSEGLLPRMLAQSQGQAFYSVRRGSDPNNFINADGRLQADRPHMFRVQAAFFNLPGGMHASTSVEFSTGRAYSRQIRVAGLGSIVIMEPIGTYRYSPIENIDLSIGRNFMLGNRLQLRFDAAVYNLLNSDQELWNATLQLQNPDETFVPVAWVKPRRMQIHFGLKF